MVHQKYLHPDIRDLLHTAKKKFTDEEQNIIKFRDQRLTDWLIIDEDIDCKRIINDIIKIY